jgi:mRNA interferase ChpB
MERGDIYFVALDPTSGHEQRGHRPVLVLTTSQFNKLTNTPVVLPITTGGAFARNIGFAVALSATKITGLIRCDQPRTLDLKARGARKVDQAPGEVVQQALAKVATLFE